MLDALEQLDLDDDPLVVDVGDHGYLLGHHGRFEKHTMWEEAVRAPLLLRNIRRLGQARSTDALVEFIDLAPTILELLGVPPMASAQGRSLVPLLDGEENRHRDYVFSALLIDNKAMVRSERWKYIFATGARPLAKGLSTGLAPPGITHRLYDLEGDPRETTNLADEPGPCRRAGRAQADDARTL